MSDFYIKQMNVADTPGVKLLVLGGAMTIQNAGEIRNALLEVFSEGNGVCLEMGTVTEADLAGLQLLCAARQGRSA